MEEEDIQNLLYSYRVVIDDDGTVITNGNNIVLQHLITKEIGYIENTKANRDALNIHVFEAQSQCSQSEIETDIQEMQEEVNIESEMGDEVWIEADVKKLISLYETHLERFRNSKYKRKEIWRDIATELKRSTGSCDKKFRNLKQHYIYLKNKNGKTGRGAIKWQYFDLLDKLFQKDTNVNPEREINIINTLEKENEKPEVNMSTPTTPNNRDDGNDFAQQQQEVDIETPRRKRRRNEDVRKLLSQSEQRQIVIEKKVDKIANLIEESNAVQRERNDLLRQYISTIKLVNQ